jgi:hypothetical protein
MADGHTVAKQGEDRAPMNGALKAWRAASFRVLHEWCGSPQASQSGQSLASVIACEWLSNKAGRLFVQDPGLAAKRTVDGISCTDVTSGDTKVSKGPRKMAEPQGQPPKRYVSA